MTQLGWGKGSPGVITLMNPGPYRPLYLWGWLVGGCQTNRPLPRGGSSRPMVARLVRYGPVRQKITFLNESPPFSLELYSESPPLCNTRPLDGPVANFRRIYHHAHARLMARLREGCTCTTSIRAVDAFIPSHVTTKLARFTTSPHRSSLMFSRLPPASPPLLLSELVCRFGGE